MKRTLPFALAACAALGSGCTVSVDSHSEILREDKRFTVTGLAELRLSTFDGSIHIQSWDKPDILVGIEKRGATRELLDKVEVKTDQKGNRIELEVRQPRSESYTGIRLHRSATANLTVSVPREVNIVARSGDGSIRIERVSGRIEARTGDGSIRASEVAGELILDTGDGSVTVDKARGRLTVDTGDGSVDAGGTCSAVKLHTGDGSVIYRADPGSSMADDWAITTGDGSVSVYLPEGFGAELDAHTADGSIRSDIGTLEGPEKDETADRRESKRTLRTRLGGGGKLLRVRTGDGAIRLRMN